MKNKSLNLLNGDCAYAEWQKTGLPGKVLVWRENYLEGILPRTDDLTEFNRIRATELHKIAPEKPENEIFAELELMNKTLFAADAVTLWFDACPFDRTMLSRILFLLNRDPYPPLIELVCRDTVWNCEAFLAHRHDRTLLSDSDLMYGGKEYLAYLDGRKPENLLLKRFY